VDVRDNDGDVVFESLGGEGEFIVVLVRLYRPVCVSCLSSTEWS
jgi:hypothetical protein